MTNRASNQQSGASRLWPATALAAVALAIGLIGQMNGLESLVYDYFQRYQYKAGSDEIVLVTVDSRANGQQDIWADSGFTRVIRRLSDLGARVIVATQPLNLPDVPNEDQMRALEELQAQAQRSTGSSGELASSPQLDEFRKRFDQRNDFIATLKSAGNVVLAAYSNAFAQDNGLAASCATHQVNLQGTDDSSLNSVRRLRYLTAPPPVVCASSGAVGLSNFWPDSDGVVRSADLIVNADGLYLPSLALASAASIAGSNHDIVVASAEGLMVDDSMTRTGSGFRILNRYYNGTIEQPAFQSATVNALMFGQVDPQLIRDRIVLVGEAANAGVPGINTPVDTNMAPLVAVASSLSNLLEQDYLLRPEWLPLLETGLLLGILLVVLLWMPTMPTIGAALLGLVLATLVIAIEVWMLVSEGIWVQLATAAIFAAAAVWTMHVWNVMTARQVRAEAPAQRAAVRKVGDQSELDLEFSVLRQQAPTEETKEKMYEIALIHGRNKEYARAESVLAHIAKIDPAYRDVSALLEKLSGARRKTMKKRRPGAASLPTDRKTLGRYEIDRVLGRGAMATVYLGRDPKINRKVAIKTVALAKEFDERELEDARLQFRREAESAGRLNHPNIIAIYDAGEDADVSYLAMEYFEGESLLVKTQPDSLLPARWVLELIARAAEALDYAHRQNVVHRDIKPANLLYHAATDELKLTDFGIARLTDSSRTKTGVILGTPSYMSPEQLSALGVTGQSDLYSLGVTMYQLLAGAAPFRADSIPKLMDKIMNEPHRPIAELRADLPPCVDAILNKAMAKEREDRFATGREMALALRECAKQFRTA